MGPRVIFIGRTASPFRTTRRDLDCVLSKLVDAGYHVDIFDIKLAKLFRVNTEEIVDFSFVPKWMYWSRLYLVYNFLSFYFFLKRSKGTYDVVHVYYIREEYLILSNHLRALGTKLILQVFGSDINSRNFIKDKLTRLYEIADQIVVANAEFGDKLMNFLKLPSVRPKIKKLLLPFDHFNLYDNFEYEDKRRFKQQLGIDLDRSVVIVGSNVTQNEQHEKIIDVVANNTLSERSHIIFMLTTRVLANDQERLEELTVLIKERLAGFSFEIVSGFISYEKMRDYRMASDIFLNFRKNDQLALSMLESNLAYCDVITADWLPYHEYRKNVEISIVEEVGAVVDVLMRLYLEDENLRIQRLKYNRDQVYLLYGYHSVIGEWLSLYSRERVFL